MRSRSLRRRGYVARVFNVVAGYDPADPYTEAGRGRREDDYTSFLDADGLEGARIGVLRALVDTEDADSGVVAVFEDALEELAGLRAEVVDPFDFDVQAQLQREGMFCGRFRYDMRVYLESLGDGAPFTDVLAVLETGEYSSYVENSLRRAEDSPLDVHPADRDPPCPDYLENEQRQGYLSDLVSAMDAAGVDALVYPTWLSPPARERSTAATTASGWRPPPGCPRSRCRWGSRKACTRRGCRSWRDRTPRGCCFATRTRMSRGQGTAARPRGSRNSMGTGNEWEVGFVCALRVEEASRGYQRALPRRPSLISPAAFRPASRVKSKCGRGR